MTPIAPPSAGPRPPFASGDKGGHASSDLETPDQLFVRMALEKRLLDERQVELLIGLAAIDRLRAQRRGVRGPSLPTIALEEGLLTRDQAMGLADAVRYFVARREDKRYARLALERGLLAPESARRLLALQKEQARSARRLPRLSALVRLAGLIPDAAEAALRAELGWQGA